jgi:CRISPR type III-B/RAMP module-associated protein Cmr3
MNMHQIFFQPQDILFCKDGRPMTGTACKGDQLPAPHVITAAILAGLHRVETEVDELDKLSHNRFRRGGFTAQKRKVTGSHDQKFGSLKVAGPFLCQRKEGADPIWYFPTPADLLRVDSTSSLYPLEEKMGDSSLHPQLKPLVNRLAPSKEKPGNWLSAKGWEQYLQEEEVSKDFFRTTTYFMSSEPHTGIGISPESGTTEKGMIYTSSRLRLKDGVELVTLAQMNNKSNEDALAKLFPKDGILQVGGEGRVCNTRRVNNGNCLPNSPEINGNRVKWTLLTPSIFPAIEQDKHTGGWLPNWIQKDNLEVQLLDGPGANKAKRLKVKAGERIKAKLISAAVGKPDILTGWSAYSGDENRSGAKSTLLAVPAGSVYYFEAENHEEAKKLAEALSWPNRRSTLMGEKGYGIGLCSNW